MERFELTLEDMDIEGLMAISIVNSPAIEENFRKFSKHQFSISKFDEEKRIITGPAMIAEQDIIRSDFDGNLYAEYFSADTIRKISEKFILDGKLNSVNLEHSINANDISIVEYWIVENSKQDKSAFLGYNLTPGSLMISMKVNNDTVWDLIKNGNLKGFSIEGFFTSRLKTYSLSDEEKEEILAQKKLDELKKLFNL
jgi:transcription antitermination factor NusG